MKDHIIGKLINRYNTAVNAIDNLKAVYGIKEADFDLVDHRIIRGLISPDDSILPKGAKRYEIRASAVRYIEFLERYVKLLKKIDSQKYRVAAEAA